MATSGIGAEGGLAWPRVEMEPPQGEALTTRLAFPGRRKDIFIGLDAVGRRHVLVSVPTPTEEGPVEPVERVSRGIAVLTRELKVDGARVDRFIDVVCLETSGHAALDVIAVEIADALDSGSSIERAALVRNVLVKWRRFWGGASQGVLSREAQIGLFGELWFLLHWLAPAIGPALAVSRWRGPGGARHDFEAPGLAVEVKTSTNAEGRHRIHGVEQLLEPSGGKLLFFGLLVRDEASAPTHLAGLVTQARELLATDQSALSALDALLDTSGYLDAFESEYTKLRLRVRMQSLQEVDGEFPRLVPASFKAEIPATVLNVAYDVVVAPTSPWTIAREPKDGAIALRKFGAA